MKNPFKKGILGAVALPVKLVALLTVGTEGLDEKKRQKLVDGLGFVANLSKRGLQNMEVELASDSLKIHFRKDF